MDAKDTLALFDRPIAFQPIFVDYTGSTNAALMLAQAFYWTKRTRPGADGWFYKSQEEWTNELRLTRREQEGARKLLRATGFWLEQRKGNPAKMYYKIDLDAFHVTAFGESVVQTRMAKNAIHEPIGQSPEPPISGVENSHTPRAPLSDQSETTNNTLQRSGLIKPRPPEDLNADPNKESRAELMEFLHDRNGPIPNPGANAKAVNWLLESGYSDDECRRCWLYLNSQQWRDIAINWLTVKKEIGAWKGKGEPILATNGNGYGNGAKPDPPRQRTQYEILKERGEI